jgi:hypothetical protein
MKKLNKKSIGKNILKASDATPAADVVRARQDAAAENMIHCRATSGIKLSASEPWESGKSVSYIYAPGGITTISAGFRKNESITCTVCVDEDTAKDLQDSFDFIAATEKQEPYADEDHEAKKATLRFPPGKVEFTYGTHRGEEGVIVKGAEPTSYGAEAVNGKTYASWSPEFATDADYSAAKCKKGHWTFPDGVRGSASNPARLIAVNFVTGALTNKPAFRNMPPVKAKKVELDAAGEPVVATDATPAGDVVSAHWSDEARAAALESRHAHGISGFSDDEKDRFTAKNFGYEPQVHSKLASIHSAQKSKASGDSAISHALSEKAHTLSAGAGTAKEHQAAAGVHLSAGYHHTKESDKIGELKDIQSHAGVQLKKAHDDASDRHMDLYFYHSGEAKKNTTQATATTPPAEDDTVKAAWSDAARKAAAEARASHAESDTPKHAENGTHPLKPGDKIRTKFGTDETFHSYNKHGQVLTKESGEGSPWHPGNVWKHETTKAAEANPDLDAILARQSANHEAVEKLAARVPATATRSALDAILARQTVTGTGEVVKAGAPMGNKNAEGHGNGNAPSASEAEKAFKVASAAAKKSQGAWNKSSEVADDAKPSEHAGAAKAHQEASEAHLKAATTPHTDAKYHHSMVVQHSAQARAHIEGYHFPNGNNPALKPKSSGKGESTKATSTTEPTLETLYARVGANGQTR